MKLKNIHPAERHVEKIIFALALAFLGYTVWAYVISSDVTVDLAGREVGPEQIDQIIRDRAEDLNDQLQGPADPTLAGTEIPDYATAFRDQISSPLTPAAPGLDVGPDRLAWTAGLTGNMLVFSGTQSPNAWTPDGDKPFKRFDLPKVASIVAEAGQGTLAANADPNVLRLAAAQPPYDAQWISVGGEVDFPALIDQLEAAEDEPGRPIPVEWINDGWAVLEVQAQRQVRLPDGSWSEPTLLPPMPGLEVWRTIADRATPQTFPQIVQQAQSNWRSILQPRFPSLTGAMAWTPPTFDQPADPGADANDGAEAVVKPPELVRLEERLADLQAKAERLQRLVSNAASESAARRLRAQLQQTQQQVEQVLAQIDRYTRGAAEASPGTVPAQRVANRPTFNFTQPGGSPAAATNSPRQRLLIALLKEPRDVWFNDLSVRSNQTYRYRLRLVVTNPLYHRVVPEEQADLGKQFTRTSAWSDWSAAVEAPRNTYFFMVGGNRSVGYSSIEVWRFYDGRWRAAEFEVFPGDAIGSDTADFVNLGEQQLQAGLGAVDFGTGLVAVDLDFNHRLAGGLGGIGQNTIRMLYTDGDALMSRLESDDRQRRTLVEAELQQRLRAMRERPAWDPRGGADATGRADPGDRSDPPSDRDEGPGERYEDTRRRYEDRYRVE